ncbi:hypothetical protein ACQJBY_016366 [Aegilops geniculata]
MDSDDEEAFAVLLEEEADAKAQDEENLTVLAALAGLFASNAKPQQGGSVPSRQKAKQRHRLEGYRLLSTSYFADAPLHGEKFITAPIIRFPSRFLPKKKKPSINNERERERVGEMPTQQSCKPLLHNASALSHATPPHSSVPALLYKPRRASPSLPHPHTHQLTAQAEEARSEPPRNHPKVCTMAASQLTILSVLALLAVAATAQAPGAAPAAAPQVPPPPPATPPPAMAPPTPAPVSPPPTAAPAPAPTVAPTPSATAPAPADSPMSSPPAPTPDMSPSPTAEPATPGSGAAGLRPAFVLAAAAVAIYAF